MPCADLLQYLAADVRVGHADGDGAGHAREPDHRAVQLVLLKQILVHVPSERGLGERAHVAKPALHGNDGTTTRHHARQGDRMVMCNCRVLEVMAGQMHMMQRTALNAAQACTCHMEIM